MKTTTLRLINTLAFIATVAVNALANLLPIGYGNTGEISARYRDLFTPAPLTFGIWGVIYLMMLGFILYQWGLFGQRITAENDVDTVGLAFAFSCAMNIGWIFAWHYDIQWLALLAIIGLLVTLWITIARLSNNERRGLARFVTDTGFDLYFGWICAAVLANVCVFLVSIGISASGTAQELRTIGMLALGTLIGAGLSASEGRRAATGSVMWAFTGILIRHIGREGFAAGYPAVIVTAALGLAVMLITLVREREALPSPV